MSNPVFKLLLLDGRKYMFYADGLIEGPDEVHAALRSLGVKGFVNWMPALLDTCFKVAVASVLKAQGKPVVEASVSGEMRQLRHAFESAVYREFGHPDQRRLIQQAIDNGDKDQQRK